jgi:hypothetical protein
MKRYTIFLQAVVVLTGIGALAFLLLEPHLEGRNAHATFFQIYFTDIFLAYAYIASIPFFAALYQAFNVLGYVRQNKIFSPAALKALKTIRYCAIAVICFIAGSIVFIYPMYGDMDDRPAGVFMRLLVTLPSLIIAASAGMFEQILKDAAEIKSVKE